jgi:preprotein translocase subunit SecF
LEESLMKRVIRFSRARYWFFALSLTLFAVGIAAYVVNGGFNLGVDFKAGVDLQFQVAPASFSLIYEGANKAELTIPAGEQALTAAGNFIITVTGKDSSRQDHPFRFSDYQTIQDFTEAVAKVEGVRVTLKGNASASPKSLIPLVRPADITRIAYTINISPETEKKTPIGMAEIRDALASLGTFNLQTVGKPSSQEFIARKEAPSTLSGDFQVKMEQDVVKALGDRFGADQVIMKQTNFVGPRMSQALASQSVWLVIIALAAILGYMCLRFPPIFAFAGVVGIAHDALFIMAYAAVFRIEFDAGAIAAILTIIGYSINDSIVIFDRVRENRGLMHDADPLLIMDTSVSQTLGRTFITSGATLLTVISLFIFTTGTIKNFAVLMLAGVLEGTYSTFISNFLVCEWEIRMGKRRKRLEMAKYGIKAKTGQIAEKPAEEVGGETETAAEGQTPASPVPGAVSAGSEAASSGDAVPAEGVAVPAQPKAAPNPQGGQQGRFKYRKKRKEIQ